jgi:fructose-1-phosphate kinase PfkB-like protein
LRELLGEQVKDGPVSLVKAGRRLLDKVDVVLISRGAKGAIVVTKDGAWQGRCIGSVKVFSTVGCGDFLLAGFLKAFKDGSGMKAALMAAIKVATARAWGWTEGTSCRGHPARDSRAGRPRHLQNRVQVQIGRI